jgi:transposase-like protein
MFRQKSLNKEAIIAEYLAGGITYRQLGEKHGVDFRLINYWVLSYQGKKNKSKQESSKSAPLKEAGEPLPRELKQLQQELHKAKLQNTLLNTIIDLAEEELQISIRKKSGTRQS